MKNTQPSRITLVMVLATVVVTTGALNLHAAGSGALPRSAFPGLMPLEAVERTEMPAIDVDELLAEDAQTEQSNVPYRARFASPIPVTFSPDSDGTWETLADGSRLWRLRITSPGALSLNLGISDFDLPFGATFWIHDPDGAQVRGPYTASSRNAASGLWTAVVLGDELVAELHLPAGTVARLEISSVNHGYRSFANSEEDALLKRGSCNVNVACPEGDPWRDQIRSVARITILGIYFCTGQMVNNTAENEIPYFLSAQHCIQQSSEAPSVVAYWNFETASCEEFFGGSLAQNQSGSTWVSSSALTGGSDFTLVELDALPDSSYDVFYSGWDARDFTPESSTAIHHPGGDQKSISLDYDPPTITSYGLDSSPGTGTHFRIGSWDVAVTEGGSSGGCLFDDATGRCVGTLSGGFAACTDNPPLGPMEPDWYGRMYRHWIGRGTPGTRLSDWLDPIDSSDLFLDGKNATIGDESVVWLIPAAASQTGSEGSNWKTQVSVVNTGTMAQNVSWYYVADGEVWPGTLLTGPFGVRPNESLYLDDVLLPEKPASGLLYATTTGGDTVAFSRTYNLAQGNATFGLGIPGIKLTDATLATEFILPMVHSNPDRYRTNLGLAQTSARNFRVLVSLFDSDGTLLAERTYAIQTAWRQINNIFNDMKVGDATVEGGWIRVRLNGGSPAYWTTYATVVDNETNDGTYVAPVAP